MSHRRTPRALGPALAVLTRHVAPRTKLARAQAAWPAAVGDAVAAHCLPVAERSGVLVVACDEAVWAAELELLAPTVIERLDGLEAGLALTALRCRADLAQGPEFG